MPNPTISNTNNCSFRHLQLRKYFGYSPIKLREKKASDKKCKQWRITMIAYCWQKKYSTKIYLDDHPNSAGINATKPK